MTLKKYGVLFAAGVLMVVAVGCSCKHETLAPATCTQPPTCQECGEGQGEALGHVWKEASCTRAKTCSRCNQTEGEPLPHNRGPWVVTGVDFAADTHTEERICKDCGQTAETRTNQSLITENGFAFTPKEFMIHGLDKTFRANSLDCTAEVVSPPMGVEYAGMPDLIFIGNSDGEVMGIINFYDSSKNEIKDSSRRGICALEIFLPEATRKTIDECMGAVLQTLGTAETPEEAEDFYAMVRNDGYREPGVERNGMLFRVFETDGAAILKVNLQ